MTIFSVFGSDLEQIKVNIKQDLLKLSEWFYIKGRSFQEN